MACFFFREKLRAVNLKKKYSFNGHHTVTFERVGKSLHMISYTSSSSSSSEPSDAILTLIPKKSLWPMCLFHFIAVSGNVMVGVMWGDDLIAASNIVSINSYLTVKSVLYYSTRSIDLHDLFFIVIYCTVQLWDAQVAILIMAEKSEIYTVCKDAIDSFHNLFRA